MPSRPGRYGTRLSWRLGALNELEARETVRVLIGSQVSPMKGPTTWAPAKLLRRVGQRAAEQPFVGFDREPLAFGVALDLVALDPADGEVGGVGVGEVDARHR